MKKTILIPIAAAVLLIATSVAQAQTNNNFAEVIGIHNTTSDANGINSTTGPASQDYYTYATQQAADNAVSAATAADYGTTAATDLGTNGNSGLYLYPNPVTSNMRIVLPMATMYKVSVAVIDLNGNILRSYVFASGSNQLDVDMSRIPTGLYSVRVSQHTTADKYLKVVKQ